MLFYLILQELFFVIKTGDCGRAALNRCGTSFFNVFSFLFVAAVNKEKNNKNCHYKNNGSNYDPYPKRNSCGSFAFANFNLNKKDGGKGAYIDGSGFCVCIGNEFYFNNGFFVCLICKGRKSGNISDNKAINSVFFNKFNIGNSGFKIGFGIIKIGVFAIGHVIFAVMVDCFNGMYHCKNIGTIIGYCACLGSVKVINNAAFCRTCISFSVGKKGKIKCSKSIAICNKF